MLEFKNNVNMFVAGAPEPKAVDPVEEYHTNDQEFGSRVRERIGDREEGDGGSRKQEQSVQEPTEGSGPQRSPLFILVEGNELSDLLMLRSGVQEQLLYFLVASQRKERGITKSVPVSSILKQGDHMIEQMKGAYRRHHNFYTNPAGLSYTGTL